MKLTRIFQNISIAVIITALGLTSCDYLDVVPPEQPNIDDAMSSPTRALGFLYSCYGGVSTDLPSAYLGEINSTTDEYVLPYSWNTDGYWGAYAFNTASSTNQDWLWGTTYQYIGQCYFLFQIRLFECYFASSTIFICTSRNYLLYLRNILIINKG